MLIEPVGVLHCCGIEGDVPGGQSLFTNKEDLVLLTAGAANTTCAITSAKVIATSKKCIWE
jgi:hypothetical protein